MLDSSFGFGVCDPTRCFVSCSERRGICEPGSAAASQVLFPAVTDVTCFSNTIDNVGKHVEFHVLDTIAQYGASLSSHKAAARLAWTARTATVTRAYSPTRW